MSMKNGTETGESGEGMWYKTDLWILEAIAMRVLLLMWR
jgi:hypothetical protein